MHDTRVTDRHALPARRGVGQSCVGDRMGRDPTVSRRRTAAAREHRHVCQWPRPGSRQKRALRAGRPRPVPHPLSRDVLALVDHPLEGYRRPDELVWQTSGHRVGRHALRGGGDWARAARRVLMLESVEDRCRFSEARG